MKRNRKWREGPSNRLFRKLGFRVASVDMKVIKDPKLLGGFRKILETFRQTNSAPEIEWMPISRYCLTADVLEKIKTENKMLVRPLDYLMAVSKAKEITHLRVCLFQLPDSRWGSFVASEATQRSISSLLSGDGFAPPCLFAVKKRVVIH